MYDRIKEKLKHEMSHYFGKEVVIKKTHKDNRELDAIFINEEVGLVPVIYLNDYIEYIDDPIISDYDVIKKIIQDYDRVLTMYKPPAFNRDSVFNWNKVKNNIYPMLINYEKNKNFIEIADTYLDFLIEYYIELDYGIARVNNSMLKLWKKDLKEIQEVAAINLLERNVLFQGLNKTFFNLIEDDLDDIDFSIFDLEESVFVLNDDSKYGATQMLNSILLNKIFLQYGAFYIVPSSIREILIAPQSIEGNNIENLKMAVEYVNSSVVIEEDFLSNNIYLYNGKEIKIV